MRSCPATAARRPASLPDMRICPVYSTTIYINGSEKETLLSNGVDDQTGETIDVSGNVGQISGDILRDSDADKLTDNLWFELKTTNLNGEESTYRVQLETTEITREVKK